MKLCTSVGLAMIVAGLGATAPALAAPAGVVSQAKISLEEARGIALKVYPGKIMKEELEKEAGGSGLRYSFDIRQGKKWREVGVDAANGKILEDIAEKPNPKD